MNVPSLQEITKLLLYHEKLRKIKVHLIPYYGDQIHVIAGDYPKPGQSFHLKRLREITR